MRIISNYRDYYDGVQAFGQDQDLVYVRHTDYEFEVAPGPLQRLRRLIASVPFSLQGDRWSRGVISDVGIIGFCGKFYPAWEVLGTWVTTSDRILNLLSDARLYNHIQEDKKVREDLIENFWPEAESKQKELVKAAKIPPKYHRWSGVTPTNLTKPSVDLCRERLEQAASVDLFADMGIPSFFLRAYKGQLGRQQSTVIANPNLGDLGLASVVDPYTAYQELSMFLGGVLPRQGQDLVEITDDNVIRDAKGHDDRSFKTPSPGKKARRRKG